MKIEKRKRIDFKNLANREKKEICCLKILKIEKRKRNENTILQLEREKHESFLLEIFSRSRLLSMTDTLPFLLGILFDPKTAKTFSLSLKLSI